MNTIEIEDKKFEILLENDNINKRIRLIGIQLNVDYEGKCPLFIGVLNGSFIFMADLLKELNIACETAFIRVASYEGTSSTGEVREVFGLNDDIRGRDLIIVEDIVDTGLTLTYLLGKLWAKEPASIRVCSLLLKPTALKAPINELEYVGFEIANEFVVGYGLDYNGLGRNLRDIYRAATVPPPLP